MGLFKKYAGKLEKYGTSRNQGYVGRKYSFLKVDGKMIKNVYVSDLLDSYINEYDHVNLVIIRLPNSLYRYVAISANIGDIKLKEKTTNLFLGGLALGFINIFFLTIILLFGWGYMADKYGTDIVDFFYYAKKIVIYILVFEFIRSIYQLSKS